MIPLALFDRDLKDYEKDQLARKIMSYSSKDFFFCSRTGTYFGKPDFEKRIPPNNLVEAVSSENV